MFFITGTGSAQGVRQLQFRLPAEWTITQVTCPSLVRWSVESRQIHSRRKPLSCVSAPAKSHSCTAYSGRIHRKNQNWKSPLIELVDADAQRGYLMINTDETLGVRGESLSSVRREDISAAALVTGLDINLGGRLYFTGAKTGL